MSEYQYYEFQAIDRPLDAGAQAELRRISSRARITATSFTNHYEWGDLKAVPREMVARWFDLHLYLANWNTRQLMIRLPRALFDRKAAHPYAVGRALEVTAAGEHVILTFSADEVDVEEWDDGSGWLASLAPLRAALMEGDCRCLYLGWLLGLQKGEVDEDEEEPPRPPGLGRLDGPLQSFVTFFGLEPDLVEAALGGADAGDEDLFARDPVEAFVRGLPADEKDAMLVRLVAGEAPNLASELRRRLRQAAGAESEPAQPVRTAGELLAAADARAGERERLEAERAAAELAERLDALARRGEAAWLEVEDLIATMRPENYDMAVSILLDIQRVAERDGWETLFIDRVATLRARHARKSSFTGRLDAAGLGPKGRR
ncbi:hypothetical protein [Azospirillum sp.]|uniref:hypothetical protein n=1 Tax=Azospirillum sp. TaxID=34012 RepID=UPI002D505550|nr:hypothetical protein [Azospirillum sp.]HYD65932.1 hypothetical protein [Azospirillum sp.]